MTFSTWKEKKTNSSAASRGARGKRAKRWSKRSASAVVKAKPRRTIGLESERSLPKWEWIKIGITGTGAAVSNAIFHATGKRIRDLPITPDKLI